MTVPATPRKAGPYAGNGVTTSFPFAFKVFAETDIQPVLTDSFGTATNLVLNSDYSVLLNADQDANPGGAVTYPILVGPSPMPAGSTLTIIGNMTLDQTTDVTNSGRFLPQVYENALDKLTILIQQLKEVSDRTLQAAIGTTVKLLFPAPSAGKFIRWRSDLTGLENVEAGTDSIALQGLLGDSTLANRGAGMIGFSSALSYPAGTAGLALKGVADIPNLTDATKGAALVGYKSTATGAVGRTLAAKLSEIISVKDFGAVGDGVTDDAAAIQAALTHAYGLGGATVMLPKGVYIVGAALVLRDNTTLQGAGLGATIIRQKASTALTSTVQTLNAYSLFGTSSIVGPPAINIRDLTIDGNRQTGATGDGLAIYAPLFSIDNIEVCNTSGTGIRTEFGTPGAIPHGYCAQSNMNNSWIHDCNSAGVRWGGPADASIVNCNIYRNLIYNLWLALPAGAGTKVTNCHMWGSVFDTRQAGTGVRCDSGGNLLVNNVIEGSTVHQVHLRSGGNVIIGGNIYYLSDATATYGVTIGDTGVPVAINSVLGVKIDQCKAGALNFANDGGLGSYDITGYNTGPAPTYGYTGTINQGTELRVRIFGDNVVTNGNETRFNATTLRLLGMGSANGGIVSAGAVDSGGTGYRMLRIQN